MVPAQRKENIEKNELDQKEVGLKAGLGLKIFHPDGLSFKEA